MQIIKRKGTTESYDREKIADAIRKSFISTQKEITDEAVYTKQEQEAHLQHQNEANRSVERIQDEVERSLMEHGFYAEAKNYILYRWQRTERRKVLSQIITGTGDDTIANILKEIQKDFSGKEYSLPFLAEKITRFYKTATRQFFFFNISIEIQYNFLRKPLYLSYFLCRYFSITHLGVNHSTSGFTQ